MCTLAYTQTNFHAKQKFTVTTPTSAIRYAGTGEADISGRRSAHTSVA